jgi:hypothetical protein
MDVPICIFLPPFDLQPPPHLHIALLKSPFSRLHTALQGPALISCDSDDEDLIPLLSFLFVCPVPLFAFNLPCWLAAVVDALLGTHVEVDNQYITISAYWTLTNPVFEGCHLSVKILCYTM